MSRSRNKRTGLYCLKLGTWKSYRQHSDGGTCHLAALFKTGVSEVCWRRIRSRGGIRLQSATYETVMRLIIGKWTIPSLELIVIL